MPQAIIIEEHPDGALVWDADGLVAPPRVWSIIAQSEVHALSILEERAGVFRGVKYNSPFGGAFNEQLLCDRIMIKPKSAGGLGQDGLYKVSAVYVAGENEQPEADDAAPAVYDWDGVLTSQPIDTDLEGNPLVTSAGETYDGITEELAHVNLKIRNYQAAFTPQTILAYTGVVNSDSWSIRDPRGAVTVKAGQAYLRKVKRTPSAGNLFLVEYEIELHATYIKKGTEYLPFNKNLLDQGLYKKVDVTDAAPTGLSEILDKEKNAVSTPQLLDGAGAVLALGGTPVTNVFETKPTKAFTPLGI